jgi:hypothetical protein
MTTSIAVDGVIMHDALLHVNAKCIKNAEIN